MTPLLVGEITNAAGLFALRVAAITARIAARGVLELAAAFGAIADHCRHHGFRTHRLSDRSFRFGKVPEPAIDQQQAFGDRLFRRREETFVEPHGVGCGHLVQAPRHIDGIKSAAKHLRRQQSHTRTDRPGDENFEYALTVVIYRHVQVLTFERDPPGRALQFAGTLYAARQGDWGIGGKRSRECVLLVSLSP